MNTQIYKFDNTLWLIVDIVTFCHFWLVHSLCFKKRIQLVNLLKLWFCAYVYDDFQFEHHKKNRTSTPHDSGITFPKLKYIIWSFRVRHPS